MGNAMSQVVEVWWRHLPVEKMIQLAVAPLAVTWLVLAFCRLWRWRRPDLPAPGWTAGFPTVSWIMAKALRWVPVAIAMVVGYRRVFARASLFDDAFISFRYARNFAEGHGLVFNLGERVEGYTNFLWTITLGILHRLTPLEAPQLALILGPLCFGANLLVVLRLGRLLTAPRADDTAAGWTSAQHAGGTRAKVVWHLPFAVLLLAMHGVYTDYGTSGLETGAASLFVNLGVLWLISRRDPAGVGLAGTMFIFAALTRPDHGLFYAIGGLLLLVELIGPLVAARRGGPARLWQVGGNVLAAYAAPFLLYGVYLLWKLYYYGDIVPNTYYAKSVALAWYAQGRVYATAFYLGTQAWAPLLLCFVWLVPRSRHAVARRFKFFFVAGFVIYNFYVAKLGGDFMYGRFYVTLVPLYLLAAEALVHQLARPRPDSRRALFRLPAPRWTAVAVALGLLAASTQAITMIRPHQIRWGIADEATYHLVKSFMPLSVDHHQEPTGRFFRRVLKDRGLEVVLGTGGPGTVGYHSRLQVIDVRGLTDAYVARQRIDKRMRPGHEKLAPREYLLARGVHLLRTNARQKTFHPSRWRRLTRVGLGRFPGRDPWQLAHYDRELMRRIRKQAPELRFVDFESWLDEYIESLSRRRWHQVRIDLKWMRAYYFDHNHDPERLAAIEARIPNHEVSVLKQRKKPQVVRE